MTTHEELVQEFNNYLKEQDKFENLGVKVSAQRARLALASLQKLLKVRRQEIQDRKNSM